MNHSNKDSLWNGRMDQVSENKVKTYADEIVGLEAQDQQKISWIQQRLNVSRGEALRIFKNSLL